MNILLSILFLLEIFLIYFLFFETPTNSVAFDLCCDCGIHLDKCECEYNINES